MRNGNGCVPPVRAWWLCAARWLAWVGSYPFASVIASFPAGFPSDPGPSSAHFGCPFRRSGSHSGSHSPDAGSGSKFWVHSAFAPGSCYVSAVGCARGGPLPSGARPPLAPAPPRCCPPRGGFTAVGRSPSQFSRPSQVAAGPSPCVLLLPGCLHVCARVFVFVCLEPLCLFPCGAAHCSTPHALGRPARHAPPGRSLCRVGLRTRFSATLHVAGFLAGSLPCYATAPTAFAEFLLWCGFAGLAGEAQSMHLSMWVPQHGRRLHGCTNPLVIPSRIRRHPRPPRDPVL